MKFTHKATSAEFELQLTRTKIRDTEVYEYEYSMMSRTRGANVSLFGQFHSVSPNWLRAAGIAVHTIAERQKYGREPVRMTAKELYDLENWQVAE